MCLGGVMGSTSCAVNENTKNVVIEAANFDVATIRRTSIRLALSSESSMRFVKGINPNQYYRVLDLSAKLLIDICGADVVEEIVALLKTIEQVDFPENVFVFILQVLLSVLS